jgi:Zn-finger nucleic acid-binding protein
MEFIGSLQGQEIHVELKYCERCGGLWLRAQGADGVYCAGCRVRLAAMPDPTNPPPSLRKPRRRKDRGRLGMDVQKEKPRNTARIDSLQGVAAMEVRA